MNETLTLLMLGLMVYFVGGSVYAYMLLSRLGVSVKMLFITTPGYLYRVSKEIPGTYGMLLKYFSLSTSLALALVLVIAAFLIE